MDAKKVNLVICKRCGEKGIFDLDQPAPKGWLEVDKVGELCAECADQYRRFMCNFMLDAKGYDIPEEWKTELKLGKFANNMEVV